MAAQSCALLPLSGLQLACSVLQPRPNGTRSLYYLIWEIVPTLARCRIPPLSPVLFGATFNPVRLCPRRARHRRCQHALCRIAAARRGLPSRAQL